MHELDAMITKKLRTSDPALLTVWKNTSRVERGPATTATAPVTPPVTASAASGVNGAETFLAANGSAGPKGELNSHQPEGLVNRIATIA